MANILSQEKLDAIIKEYSRTDGYYDGIPPCVSELSPEEKNELERLLESGELVIKSEI